MQTERRVAANPQTKPTDLGCESANKWLLPSTSTIAICYYYSAQKLTLILPSHGGWRLGRPRHCRKGAQPVSKNMSHNALVYEGNITQRNYWMLTSENCHNC